MAGKLQSGLELSKQSWSALGQNRQLIVFPLISGIAMIIVTILFFIPEAFAFQPLFEAEDPTAGQWIATFLVLFFYYWSPALWLPFLTRPWWVLR